VRSSAIIVIPSYNGAGRLPVHTFQTFTCEWHALRFLFVDNGSIEDTWQVLQPSTRLALNARLDAALYASSPPRPPQQMGHPRLNASDCRRWPVCCMLRLPPGKR
jgi:hypothetical protein